MSKTKNNEEIIAALLQYGTIKEAAAAVGLSPRAIYERMTEKEFRREYAAAKSEITRAAVKSLTDKLSEAIDTIAQIMTDPNANPGTRLQAAKLLLENAGRFVDRLGEQEATVKKLGPHSLFEDVI